MICQQSCTPSQGLNTESPVHIIHRYRSMGLLFLFLTWKCAALAGYLGLRLSTYYGDLVQCGKCKGWFH